MIKINERKRKKMKDKTREKTIIKSNTTLDDIFNVQVIIEEIYICQFCNDEYKEIGKHKCNKWTKLGTYPSIKKQVINALYNTHKKEKDNER